MKEDEMGGSHGTDVGEERCKQGFWQGNIKERDKLGNQSADGKVILKLVLKK
jgi:hypothetical protein